jgi:hypothetical protein
MMNASTDNGAWARTGASPTGGTAQPGGSPSPADLEREGEEIRADLDRTLDEIERKLSPGELLDRSVDFLRNNGSDFIREAGETVRSNPIPVLLTAAGLIWLTTSIASRNRARSSGYAEGGEFSRYRGSAEFGEEDYSQEGGSGIRGKVEEARSRMSNAAHRVTDRVSGKAHDVAGRVRGSVSSSMHSMQDRTQGMRSNVLNLVQEQPIALGALALAAGALLGAALPITQYENRLVGPARDRTLARAKELGQREYENLKQAVSTTRERGGSSKRTGESSLGTTSTDTSNQAPEQG